MHQLTHATRRAFSLIEMAIVLAIISVVLAGVLPFITESAKNSDSEDTLTRMQQIEMAVIAYVASEGGMPCPADRTTSVNAAAFGVAATAGSNSCGLSTTPAAAGYEDATAGVAVGAVPTKTLGLPDEVAFDGWGRRITYYVTLDNIGSQLPATGAIIVDDAVLTGTDYRTSQATFALVSHGANGHGGYTIGGTPYNAGSTNVAEHENCNCDASLATAGTFGLLVQAMRTPAANPTQSFDDITRFMTKSQMELIASGAGTPTGGGASTEPCDTPAIAPTGFPDAIRCNSATYNDLTLHYVASVAATGNVVYRYIQAGGVGSWDITYDASGNFVTQNDLSGYDCVTGSMSIAALEAANKTSYFGCSGSGGGSGLSGDCPSGFTKIQSNGVALGCMQDSEQSAATYATANATCFSSFGGRLPSYGEALAARAETSFTMSNVYWLDSTHWNGSAFEASTLGNGGTNDSPGNTLITGSLPYRCWIPNQGGGSGGGGGGSEVSVSISGPERAAGAGAWNKYDFDTENYDNGGYFDIATDRFTPQVAGKYLVTFSGSSSTTTDGHALQIGVAKNGSVVSSEMDRASIYSAVTVNGSGIVDMNGTTDYIELFCYYDSVGCAASAEIMLLTSGSGGGAGGGVVIESGQAEIPDYCSNSGTQVNSGSSFFCTSGLPSKDIVFTKTFQSAPHIVITPVVGADSGLLPCTGGAADQIGSNYANVTTTGFTASAWMSPDSSGGCGALSNNTGAVRFNWLAIGEGSGSSAGGGGGSGKDGGQASFLGLDTNSWPDALVCTAGGQQRIYLLEGGTPTGTMGYIHVNAAQFMNFDASGALTSSGGGASVLGDCDGQSMAQNLAAGRGHWFGGSGGGSGTGSGQCEGIVPSMPDSITCVSGGARNTLFHSGGSTAHTYRRIVPPTQTTDNSVVFNSDGSFNTQTGMTGYDCASGSMSITDLYAAGQAHDFCSSEDLTSGNITFSGGAGSSGSSGGGDAPFLSVAYTTGTLARGSVIPFNNVIESNGLTWSTDRFIAPEAGTYLISVHGNDVINPDGSVEDLWMSLQIARNGTAVSGNTGSIGDGEGGGSIGGTSAATTLTLAAGDEIQFVFSHDLPSGTLNYAEATIVKIGGGGSGGGSADSFNISYDTGSYSYTVPSTGFNLVPTSMATERFDNGDNVSGGVFTAPETGVYHFSGNLTIGSNAITNFYATLAVNNTNFDTNNTFGSRAGNVSNTFPTSSLSSTLELNQGDTVQLAYHAGSTPSSMYILGSLSGYKIGGSGSGGGAGWVDVDLSSTDLFNPQCDYTMEVGGATFRATVVRTDMIQHIFNGMDANTTMDYFSINASAKTTALRQQDNWSNRIAYANATVTRIQENCGGGSGGSGSSLVGATTKLTGITYATGAFPAGSPFKADMSAATINSLGAADLANDRIIIPQAGEYLVKASAYYCPQTTHYTTTTVRVNGTNAFSDNSPNADGCRRDIPSEMMSLNAGDIIELLLFDSANGPTGGISAITLSVTKMR